METSFMLKNKAIELNIDEIASTGNGVGFIDDAGFKRPVFVPLTVPGDIVKAKIIKKHKKYYEAKLIKIISESKFRIKPVCEHFGICGACDFLHISYKKQLDIKKAQLKLYLDKNNIIYDNIEVIKSDKIYHYRDKARFAIDNGKYGFYAKSSNQMTPIKHCHIIAEKLNDILLKKPNIKGEESFAYDYKTKSVISENEKRKCHYYYGDIEFEFYPGGFVQNNLMMNNILQDLIVKHANGNKILDLYSGNGNLSIPLSKKFMEIISVEGSKASFSLLKSNLTKNKIKNVLAVNQDVNQFIRITNQYDTIVLDPPRTGALSIIGYISNMTNNIIYVSCSPMQLAKELKLFLKSGFSIKNLYLIDMFCQTKHFETIAVLIR